MLTAADCDDLNAASTIVAEDADCDGHVASVDCDDTNPDVNPGMKNGGVDDVDEDCDGLADDADDSVTETIDYVPDSDGDGFGDKRRCRKPGAIRRRGLSRMRRTVTTATPRRFWIRGGSDLG